MKKTKKKTKATTKRVSKKRLHTKVYEAHYLALILIAFLLFEGFMFTNTNASDWGQAVSVLDMSAPVVQTASDINVLMQPVAEAVNGVNQFYQLSATSMMELLDMSTNSPMSDVSFVMDSVTEFYQQASYEMASLLDVSSVSDWPAQVAGVSISVQQ